MQIQDLTALITCRNSQDTIEDCLNSLHDFGQVIVWDDQSEDNTVKVIKTLYPRVKVHTDSTQRHPLNRMRKMLSLLADTEWVVFQDSDDWRVSHMTHYHSEVAKRFDVLITPYIQFANGTPSKVVIQQSDFLSDLALCTIQTNGIYWKKSVLDSIEFPEEASGEYAILYEAFKAGAKIGYSELPGSIYCQGGLYSTENATAQLLSHLKLQQQVFVEQKLTASQYNYVMKAIENHASHLPELLTRGKPEKSDPPDTSSTVPS